MADGDFCEPFLTASVSALRQNDMSLELCQFDADVTGYRFSKDLRNTTGHFITMVKFRNKFRVLQSFAKLFSLRDYLLSTTGWMDDEEATKFVQNIKDCVFAHAGNAEEGLRALNAVTNNLVPDARVDEALFSQRDGFREGQSLCVSLTRVDDVRSFLEQGEAFLKSWHAIVGRKFAK